MFPQTCEGRHQNTDMEKRSGVCSIVFYLSMHSCTVHEYYQIEITIHPQLFPFTLDPASPLLSTILPSTMPFLSVLSINWKANRQKAPVLSAMCWLIVMAQSLYPNNAVKRLYPERVLACVVHLT